MPWPALRSPMLRARGASAAVWRMWRPPSRPPRALQEERREGGREGMKCQRVENVVLCRVSHDEWRRRVGTCDGGLTRVRGGDLEGRADENCKRRCAEGGVNVKAEVEAEVGEEYPTITFHSPAHCRQLFSQICRIFAPRRPAACSFSVLPHLGGRRPVPYQGRRTHQGRPWCPHPTTLVREIKTKHTLIRRPWYVRRPWCPNPTTLVRPSTLVWRTILGRPAGGGRKCGKSEKTYPKCGRTGAWRPFAAELTPRGPMCGISGIFPWEKLATAGWAVPRARAPLTGAGAAGVRAGVRAGGRASACVRACVRASACVRACARRVRACVCVRVRVCARTRVLLRAGCGRARTHARARE